MRRPRWSEVLSAVCLTYCLLALAGCGGNELDDLVRAISKSQAVDENTVRSALRREATTEDEQLKLAKQWNDTLPAQELPDVDSILDDLAKYGHDQLKSATCSALIDIAQTGQVPSGQQFVTNYLTGLFSGGLPQAELQALVDTFDELWVSAAAGTLTGLDIRLTLLELQYC